MASINAETLWHKNVRGKPWVKPEFFAWAQGKGYTIPPELAGIASRPAGWPVLDGRNRLRACIETGTPPVFREWNGPDPLAFVLGANLHRRHLDESQRAMVAAHVATLPRGANQHTEISACSQGRASELLSVSPDSIQFARKVIERGTPELVAAVEQGAVKVSAAAHLADADPAYQLGVLGKIQAGLPVTEARRQLKRESLKTAPWPKGKYRVLYADPPWRYGNDLARCMTGSTSAADHYPSMSIAELCELPVTSLAMDDAVLFMWLPAPLVVEGEWLDRSSSGVAT